MPKSKSASDKLMGDYFAALLQDDVGGEPSEIKPKEAPALVVTESLVRKPIEKLLKQVAQVESEPLKTTTKVEEPAKETTITTVKVAERMPERPKYLSREPEEDITFATGSSEQEKSKGYREGSFQALFFDVAGLTIAVPLITLGGIHELTSINSLMGKPPWFKGVMLHRDRKINVVDSAKWVMPEKCNDNLLTELDYRFLIMLGDSDWGMMAENLIDTVTLHHDDVKWREQPGKRPWLAGLVKDRMCALVDVDATIGLLNQGLSVSSQ